ncbi:hypothetical protein [Salinispora tropica]|uniref:hypothetical protein n=1 Tax=Salinispora tropica TaxID=168695 RepID=UPI000491E797|nr:hypothetical protein [Salinispora tropica]
MVQDPEQWMHRTQLRAGLGREAALECERGGGTELGRPGSGFTGSEFTPVVSKVGRNVPARPRRHGSPQRFDEV